MDKWEIRFTGQDVVDALMDMDDVEGNPTEAIVNDYIRSSPDLLDVAREEAAAAVADRLRFAFTNEP